MAVIAQVSVPVCACSLLPTRVTLGKRVGCLYVYRKKVRIFPCIGLSDVCHTCHKCALHSFPSASSGKFGNLVVPIFAHCSSTNMKICIGFQKICEFDHPHTQSIHYILLHSLIVCNAHYQSIVRLIFAVRIYSVPFRLHVTHCSAPCIVAYCTMCNLTGHFQVFARMFILS